MKHFITFRYNMWLIYWNIRCLLTMFPVMVRHYHVWQDSRDDLLWLKCNQRLVEKSRETRKAEYRFFTDANYQARKRMRIRREFEELEGFIGFIIKDEE